MANYIHAIIRGDQNLDKYCRKRFGERPHFVETIGRVGNAKVYLRYWSSPTDNGYYDYYVLIMEDERGKYYSSTEQIIKECREAVETGKARLLTP